MTRKLSFIAAMFAVCFVLAAGAAAQTDPFSEAVAERERRDGSEMYFRARQLTQNPAKREAARTVLQVFLEQYPKSVHRADALLLTINTFDPGNEDERILATGFLRTLLSDFPREAFTPQVLDALSAHAGVRFHEFPRRWRTGEGQELMVSAGYRAGWFRDHSQEVRLFRIPESAYQKALAPGRSDGQPTEPEAVDVPRGSWVKISQRQERMVDHGHGTMTKKMTFDMAEPGLYVIEQQIGAFTRTTWVRAMSFALLTKHLNGRLLAATVDPWTGKPLADVEIEVRTGANPPKTKTGVDGIAWLDLPSPKKDENNLFAVVATRGKEMQHCWLDLYDALPLSSRVYITTDRPIYRPNQTVHFKAVRRDITGRTIAMPAKSKVRAHIEVQPEDWEDPRILQSGLFEWNEHGSISGSFELGSEPMLGNYRVVVHVPRSDAWSLYREDLTKPAYWSQSFVVSAYRKPEYAVTVAVDDGAPQPGAKVSATISAAYYFGGAVRGATVKWRVIAIPRNDYYYGGSVRRGTFDDSLTWYRNAIAEQVDTDWWWPEYDEESDGLEVDEGEGKLDEQGRLAIAFETMKLDAAEMRRLGAGRETGRPVKYIVRAEVTDLSFLSADGQASFISSGTSLALRTGVERMYYVQGDTVGASCKVTDHSGAPQPGTKVKVTALSIPLDYLGDEGGQTTVRGVSVVEFESFFTGEAVTDADGVASVAIADVPPGPVRLIYRAADRSGRITEEREDIDVQYTGADEVHDEERLIVLPEKAVYREGETMRLMVRTWKKPLTALLTVSAGTIHEARFVTLDKFVNYIELPAKGAYAPNVMVNLAGWDPAEQKSLAGGFEFYVFPDSRMVDVEVTTDRATYAPGEKAKVRVVTRVHGKPVPAEVELGIVDEAIFALLADRSKEMRGFFVPFTYPYQATAGTIEFDDNADSIVYTGRQSATTLFSDTSSGGSSGEERAPLAPAALRKKFGDTMHYAGHVVTGADGSATIDVNTLDNLTTWRITARAASGKDAFGAGVGSTVTTKPVIVRLSTPRFYRQGDSGTIAAVVHNHIGKQSDFTVKLTGTGVAIADDKPRTVNIGVGGEKRITWQVKAEKLGEMKLKVEALSTLGSDAMEVTLPVLSRGIDQFIARSSLIDGAWKHSLALPEGAYADSASLEIHVGSPSVEAVRGALPYLAKYPYGCVEQTMSRFLPALVAKQSMDRLGIKEPMLETELPKMMKKGLDRLINFQHQDGGWGWWNDDASHPRMTAYVIFGLTIAKEAGMEIPPGTVERGIKWLEEHLNDFRNDNPDVDYAFAIYALHAAGREVKLLIQAYLDGPLDRREVDPGVRVGREPDPGVWAYLVLAGRHDLATSLPKAPPKDAGPHDVFTTALIIRALTAADAKSERLAPHVNWLMSQRRGGSWHSTLDTAYAVLALATMRQPARSEPVMVRVTVNGKEVKLVEGKAVVDAAGLNAKGNEIVITRLDKDGDAVKSPLFASAILRFHSTAAEPDDTHVEVRRRIERYVGMEGGEKQWKVLKSGDAVRVNDELRVVLWADSGFGVETPLIESPIAAGTELVQVIAPEERPEFGGNGGRREYRDDRFAYLPWSLHREHTTFTLRPTFPGVYHVSPTVAYGMYDPDKRGHTAGFILRVEE